MTQAERTRTIKYVLAESSRWLLHRRRKGHEEEILDMRKLTFSFKSVFMDVRFELTTSSSSPFDDALFMLRHLSVGLLVKG